MEKEIKTLKELSKAYFDLLGLITKKGVKKLGEPIIFSRKDLLKIKKIHEKLGKNIGIF